MVETFDIQPIKGKYLVQNWGQWVLISLGLATMTIGLLYIFYRLIRNLRRHYVDRKRNQRGLMSRIERHFRKSTYTPSLTNSIPKRIEAHKPSSFRVYLGSFSKPISEQESKILFDYDLVILDPLQPSVIDAVASIPTTSQKPHYVVGRLDLENIVRPLQKNHEGDTVTIPAFDLVFDLVSSNFLTSNAGETRFTGILLAGWETLFSFPVINELARYLSKLGLDVYLETGPPNFIQDVDAVASEFIVGLVIRNGLILSNGQRRDCFAMENLRTTMKAFISQDCLRTFTTMMWDQTDKDVTVDISVMRRSFLWCRFYNTLSWITRSNAVYAADAESVNIEPLSAFDWLKDADVMRLHSSWGNSLNTSSATRDISMLEPLHALFPSLNKIWEGEDCHHCVSDKDPNSYCVPFHTPGWTGLDIFPRYDAISISETGDSFDGLGCFPIGVEITMDDFEQVVQSQQHFRRLDLLDAMSATALRELGTVLAEFATADASLEEPSTATSVQSAIKELSAGLSRALDDCVNSICVYTGLDSGFRCTPNRRFWGVYSTDSSTTTNIYISKNNGDTTGTVLHTFMSSRGFTRPQCFAAEVAFKKWSKALPPSHNMTSRMLQDVTNMSPSECLFFLQRTALYDQDLESAISLRDIRQAVEEQLLKSPSETQLKNISAIDYIRGDATMQDVIASRLEWHCKVKSKHPSLSACSSLFTEVEVVMLNILRQRKTSDLASLTETLGRAMLDPWTDSIADILALAVFCVIKKLALEEIYIEVTDRNPLFNNQPDQAAAFAELFALGSRCASYFDMSPSEFGKILLGRFYAEYSDPQHQPPSYVESSMPLRSAFSEAQIDVDSREKPYVMPAYQRLTFMSVFAIPALIDVMLLTTTEHGLYLSARMSYGDQKYATIAFLLSLLLSGAIGTWIACGGSYYLESMAFSAMNYFVVTRLLGGLTLLLPLACVGLIVVSCISSLHNGLIFFFYFIGLTIYLSLLAALANYSAIGSAFQSGRVVIISALPILFISPLITIFVSGHDTLIYLMVLYIFNLVLLLGTRRIGALWTTWHHKITMVDDAELKRWYVDRAGSIDKAALEKMGEPALLKTARQSLLHEVLEARRWFASYKKTTDPLALKLARSYDATRYLLDWYGRSSGMPKPSSFSSTWNGQVKVALKTLQQSQRGIRFHNGFLHWRQAGDEIGCTVLYFTVALLDKWIALVCGRQSLDSNSAPSGALLGLTPAQADLRMPVGLGLAYYLIGAVLLDFNAQKLQELAALKKEQIVGGEDKISSAAKAISRSRTRLYWTALRHYLYLHLWSLVVTSTFLWIFSSSNEGVIVFLSYVVAYTGLLWYQYTKTFAGPHALRPLFIGVFVGLLLGFILRFQSPSFKYTDIIALGVATWTVAILSLWTVEIVARPKPEPILGTKNVYHAFSGAGPDQAWSQPELARQYETLISLPGDLHFVIDPRSYAGKQITQIISSCTPDKFSSLAKGAFPMADELIYRTVEDFQDGKVTFDIIPTDLLQKEDGKLRGISCETNGLIRIFAGCEVDDICRQQIPFPILYQIAEILLHATAEFSLAYSHGHSILAESLLTSAFSLDASTNIPCSVKAHIDSIENPALFSTLRDHFTQQFMQELCLGLSPDLQWDKLPEDVRKYLVQRCLGHSIPPSDVEKRSLQLVLGVESTFELEAYLARCDYAAFVAALCLCNVTTLHTTERTKDFCSSTSGQSKICEATPRYDISRPQTETLFAVTRRVFGHAYHKVGTACKFVAVALTGDPEYQRELDCILSEHPKVVSAILRLVLNSIWSFSKNMQKALLPFFLFHNRENVVQLWQSIQGRTVSFKRRRIVIQTPGGRYSAFVHRNEDGSFKLYSYNGNFDVEPEVRTKLCSIGEYSQDMSVLRRHEFHNGNLVSKYEYEYANLRRDRLSRSHLQNFPITRRCVEGRENLQVVNYNSKGFIDSGSYLKDDNLVRFRYHYRRTSKFGGELLRAEFVLPHMSCTVSWCAPPPRNPERLDKWISHSQVMEAAFVIESDVWVCKYFYDHKLHPTIFTTLNGNKVATPPLILHDHLDVLKKPQHISFLDDNPLYSFKSVNPNSFLRMIGLYKRFYPVPTSQARSSLWTAWKNNPEFDGVVTRWLDERLLRRDTILQPYWRMRDYGSLDLAKSYLKDHHDALRARVDLDDAISSWTSLALKLNDLFSFGTGGDANPNTTSNFTSQEDDTKALHVIAADTGTWPIEGGGVSACRRDLVNNLNTIKWHVVAEAANDYGLPKHQIEKNVDSLKIIPLWGLDLMTPTHGLFQNRLDSEIKHITRQDDLDLIYSDFVPILAALVSGARSLEFSISDVKQTTRALLRLNEYFCEDRHWTVVWNSHVVKSAWRRLWLSKLSDNVSPCSEWLHTELPTLGQMDQALDLWSRYLFIFSIQIPDEIPDVYQASHHSVSASYGIICKIKRQCNLQIWDHAISWRETNLYLSSALCPLAPFVRNSMLGLLRMTSVLILHHADTILPCADFFNPDWEVEIGTCEGTIEHRNTFRRKIDPVVNGITDMKKFSPVQEIKTKSPTVTMLSHLWYAKDIKTAILAADIIVNEWGFKEYHLDIYGAVDKVPSYTTSCQEIISNKSLRENVVLRGEANPIQVLEKTWVFINSSISEGLPLALGEAALTGAPVVCTDVGASLRVLTDPVTNERYSAVVAPNDARAMAKAQIEVLAMMGEWHQYADPIVSTTSIGGSNSGIIGDVMEANKLLEENLVRLPESPTKEEVKIITKRMYDQTPARRRLGMRSRAIVEKSFGGERYLREHEQMLWVGKAMKDMKHRATTVDRHLPREVLSIHLDEQIHPDITLQDNNELAIRIADSSRGSSSMGERTDEEQGTTTGTPPSLIFGGSTNQPSLKSPSVSTFPRSVTSPDYLTVQKPQRVIFHSNSKLGAANVYGNIVEGI